MVVKLLKKMVDSHYIKRGNKLYGPYYYRSYRVGKKVKKEYLGKNYIKKAQAKKTIKSLLFSFVLLILIASILYLIPYFAGITSKAIAEFSPTTLENNESSQLSAENITMEISETIASATPQINLSELANITLNETATEENESNISEINTTYPLVEQPGVNLSNATNATEHPAEINATPYPLKQDENITNETRQPVGVKETVLNETLVQHKAVIGRPVKWTKKIVLEKPSNLTTELPKEASNITIKKIVNETSEFILTGSVSITGQVTSSINLTGRKKEITYLGLIKYLLRKIRAKITGHAVEETPQIEIETNGTEKIIEIKENVTEVEVEYYTDAPQATEEQIPQGKKIIISGPDELHYQDILTYTYLDKEVGTGEAITLYWINGSKKQKVDFTAYDTNNNSLIDYIEWIVPSLSNQTYEVSITETNAQKKPDDLGEELADKRTYNQKVFDAGEGKQRYIIHTAQINYKDEQGNFQEINTTLNFDEKEKAWEQSNASYHSKIPEYADDWFEFYNTYEGANQTIKAKPVASHVKGEYFNGDDGQGVIYKDAFGTGIDLKVYAYWAGLKKVIIINGKPTDISKDLTFDFELELPVSNIKNKDKNGKDIVTSDIQVKDTKGNLWDKATTLDFKDKTLKIGDDGKESYFRNAFVWDSGELNQPVDIELYKQGNKIYLRKTITADVLQKAVYPLYTDHPTSYYAGAGDGYVYTDAMASWDSVHDRSSGSAASYTTTTNEVHVRFANTVSEIDRSFLPIDTSGIDDGATITSAILYLYVTSKLNNNDDGNDWVNVIQTSQANPTTLTIGDYDQAGAINNPTEGATRLDITDITTSAYNVWTLNATGINWIDKVNVNNTLLGLREGHDALDIPPAYNLNGNKIIFSTSEDTSGTKDPYLDVTAAPPNTAPFIQNISITPAAAHTDSTLNCSANYGDAESDKGNVSITWYNGSAQYSATTILNVVAGAMVSNATLSGIQALGETWNCTINATDAQGLAGNPNSTTRTIVSNSAPNITSISITPNIAYTDSALNCSGIYTDIESDKGNVSITWYNGSTQYSTATILNVVTEQMVSNATLSGIQAIAEIWNCTINATDAWGAGGLPNSTVTNSILGILQGLVLDGSNSKAKVNGARVVIVNQSDNVSVGSVLTNSTGGWVFNISAGGTYMAVAYYNTTLKGAASPHINVT